MFSRQRKNYSHSPKNLAENREILHRPIKTSTELEKSWLPSRKSVKFRKVTLKLENISQSIRKFWPIPKILDRCKKILTRFAKYRRNQKIWTPKIPDKD